MEKIKTTTQNNIFIDDFGNIIMEGDFTLCLGKVDNLYNFKPSKFIMEQSGLSIKYLELITELIKNKAGYGKKKDEPIEENSANN
jgi:hypothetical protein